MIADNSWTLQISRDDLSNTRLVETLLAKLEEGEALLRVDRVGVTANNITYAVLGDAYRYWEFFPTEAGWGVVPLWGFAEVVASRADGVEVGSRVYGYLPSAAYLKVAPVTAGDHGFRDGSAHRAHLPSPYNAYAFTSGDAAYEAQREDLLVLYRPLYWTSFMLADWLIDTDCRGAGMVVMSSASSKTAHGTAFELHRQGRRVIGLTSPQNVAFTAGLGCYDEVLSYDDMHSLTKDSTVLYADFAGNVDLSVRLRTQLGSVLVHEVVVGVTHQRPAPAGNLAKTGGEVFFAPTQMNKRIKEWGREGVDRKFAESWGRFAPVVETWVDVVVGHGPEDLQRVWHDVLAGNAAPREGHVLQL